jgi:hypothetical protein
MSNDDTIQDFIYGDGQPDGATVREVLTLAYGDDWERQLSDVVTVGERSEMQYVTDASGFRNFRHDYFPLIVIRLTCGRSVYGYEDALEVANYRVLRDEWSDVEGLTDGPYSDSSHIALDLDKPAPTTLVETLESLRNYPSLSDDEYSTVEQEMILEHWESYGRSDTLDAVAQAIGADSSLDLTDYAGELVEQLTFSGQLFLGNGGEYPSLIDSSAAEFGADVVAQWIRARLGLVVPVTGYGNRPLFIAYCNRRNLIAA